jgi:hypothetical protein
MNDSIRINRRDLARFGLGALALGATGLGPARLLAAPKIESTQRGEMPTTGGLRPGPLGLSPQPLTTAGFQPVAISIEKAGVDAAVETREIVDGVMQDPTGPWVVSWYKETGRLGVPDENVVMAAHVDYWDVGPAVFYNIRVLAEGDNVDVTGDDGSVYRYAVEWQKLFDADNAPIQEIVGPTDESALTLITCGGQFDYANGHYISRTVVRCKFAEKLASTS